MRWASGQAMVNPIIIKKRGRIRSILTGVKTMKFRTKALALALFASAGFAGNAQAASISSLFNTGTDASNVALVGGNGVTDSHYQILSSTSLGLAGNQAVTFNCCYFGDDANSRWISLSPNGSPSSNTTVYRTTFDLTGLNPLTALINGRWAIDNLGTIFLNGANTGVMHNAHQFYSNFSLSSGFVAGLNTLDFSITDQGGPTAFRVDDLVGTADLAGTGGVPEPASWALMIAGFGLVGSAARRRATVRVAYA
jgi:PEP-CTERM motif